MTDDQIMDGLRLDEGVKNVVYRDSEGHLTWGVGHRSDEGCPVCDRAIEAQFQHDYDEAVFDYASIVRMCNLDLNEVRRGVLINMLFNMGRSTVLKFTKMLDALEKEDYGLAADEMKDNRWYRQVGNRAVELVEMMRTGKIGD